MGISAVKRWVEERVDECLEMHLQLQEVAEMWCMAGAFGLLKAFASKSETMSQETARADYACVLILIRQRVPPELRLHQCRGCLQVHRSPTDGHWTQGKGH